MSFKVYLVEDERYLNKVLSSYLSKEGWEVRSFLNGEDAEEKILDSPHLWILDIMLPGKDGYQLLKKIKEYSPLVPVIFISARNADLDRILGLELGSDDYLAKPFMPQELVIRVQKLLDRVYGRASEDKVLSVINLYPYVIDEENRIIKQDDKEIKLTSKEFDLVSLFAHHSKRAFSREQILSEIWGEDYFGSDRTVDDLIRRLRKKLPDLKIETIYGYGYRLVTS